MHAHRSALAQDAQQAFQATYGRAAKQGARAHLGPVHGHRSVHVPAAEHVIAAHQAQLLPVLAAVGQVEVDGHAACITASPEASSRGRRVDGRAQGAAAWRRWPALQAGRARRAATAPAAVTHHLHLRNTRRHAAAPGGEQVQPGAGRCLARPRCQAGSCKQVCCALLQSTGGTRRPAPPASLRGRSAGRVLERWASPCNEEPTREMHRE